VNTNIHVLFLSASTADETVLSSLLAGEEAGAGVHLFAAGTAQVFYDAIYSEQRYRVIVIDERQTWSDWRGLVATCTKNLPNALLVLLAGADRPESNESALGEGVAAVYPRNSAGLIALARLVSKLAAQDQGFSLRHEPLDADADRDVEEEREKLVYAVSHDLQDPLQLARRYADILNEDFESKLGDSGSKVLGHLQFNLSRTQEMLDELLDYSRLQNSRPEKQPVDFNELLDEVIDLYRLTLDEIGGTISKQNSLPTLVVDRRQFLRVLQNLVGNAIKFRSERALHISLRSQRVRNEWRIGVKDNGIGLEEEDAKRVFDMFERAGVTEDHPGTGMGLAICKRIVKNHGGNIWVRSSPGAGSVFIFSVPQTDERAEVPAG